MSIHETAIVDEGAIVGESTKVWHFSHVMSGAVIGENCILGQNVHIANDVKIGNNVKIQNNVSVYSGTTIEDDVFLGPSCVLTNVTNPRSQIDRHALYEKTLIRRGATIGANATVVCGHTIGQYAFIAAGAVVTKDVPDYRLVMGVPGKVVGYVSRHGHRLCFDKPSKADIRKAICPESGWSYSLHPIWSGRKIIDWKVTCIDFSENEKLPEDKAVGTTSYGDIRDSK
jgi:UDP-2-acetamido-3-amino-2,3-dideoxy-glucuronate N-acetyltransferase